MKKVYFSPQLTCSREKTKMSDVQNNDHDPHSPYMEQEEEWEREGLLDPAWEKQQRKVRCIENLPTLRIPAMGVL